MIVSRQEANRIEAGRKHQLRIPQSRVAPARLTTIPISFREPNAHLGFDVFGKPKLETVTKCHVRVLDVTPGVVQDITDEEAKLEGFRTRWEFAVDWKARYGEPRPKYPVWTISFEVDRQHRPRFLSRGVVAGKTGDYVTSPARALPHEDEAVDEVTLRRLVHEARARHEGRIEKLRAKVRELPLEQQVAVYQAQARERHVCIRSEVRQLERYADNVDIVERQINLIREKLEGRTASLSA